MRHRLLLKMRQLATTDTYLVFLLPFPHEISATVHFSHLTILSLLSTELPPPLTSLFPTLQKRAYVRMRCVLTDRLQSKII